jgi:hypothetical protein
VGFLAGLVVAAPLTGAAIGAFLGGVADAALTHLHINEQFIRDVQALMKPGSSALFLLDEAGDMDVILNQIRGLGGSVLKNQRRSRPRKTNSVHFGRFERECLTRRSGQPGQFLQEMEAVLHRLYSISASPMECLANHLETGLR